MPDIAAIDSNGVFDDERVIAARKVFAGYAGKIPKDPYCYDQWMMGSLHAIIFNYMEAVYRNSTRIAPHDLQNYLDFARDCFTFVDTHHRHEETIYFPAFEKFYSMDANRAQHAEFLPILAHALAYLDSVDPRVSASPTPFAPATIRTFVDSFLGLAAGHMVDELETLSPERIRTHDMLKEAHAAHVAVVDEIKRTEEISVSVPRLVYNRPPGCEFPDDAPQFVISLLTPVVGLFHYGRNKYYWTSKRWEHLPPNKEWLEAEETKGGE